ncbi:MAG: YdcH family protein [Janthinobacterium lividum]
MTNAHLTSLSTKHAQLDAKLAAEVHNPLPDSLRIAQLKKEKLRLKEQIVQPH